MKHFLVLILLALLTLPVARADAPDDQYVAIYTLIQQGDALSEQGLAAAAISKYVAAQASLKRFEIDHPDTYTKVINFRLKYVAGKIAALSAEKNTNAAPALVIPAPASVTPPASENTEPAKPVVVPAPAPPATDWENQAKGLQEQVRRLEADRSSLEAKLKEALAAVPAAADPKELTKAQDQITSLQRENGELKASLASASTNVAPTPAAAAANEKAQAALADANRKVAALVEANAILAQEKETLQTRVKTLTAPDASTAALREENTLLKKQLADLKTTPANDASNDAVNRKLQETQTQLAALQSDKEILRLEKIALETRVKSMATSTNAAPMPQEAVDSVTATKIAQLEAQREEMKKTLDAVSRETQGRKKGAALSIRLDDMARQIASLRARIDVLEAHPVPYSEAELALFSQSTNALMASARSSAPRKPKIKEPTAAAAARLSEGQQFFLAGDMDKAEAKYKEALKYDEKNPNILADLASIQLTSGHLDDAEKNIKAALALAPDDDYNLFVLGKLKFQQKNYDEAFDDLSKAAQLNPKNAKIQNFLGLTLSEKGVRGPAETAFRQAIILDPGYADAHINLAVVYATHQPPYVELARWHYQKALATGHPPSPAVEKLIDPTKTAAAH